MKQLLYSIVICIAFFGCKPAENAEIPVKYGSNDGKYLTIRNTRVYYEEYGNGVPLLLLHQGLGSIENLGAIIPELSGHFRVIAYDAPGHGRSEQADSLSGALLADYGSALIDQLKLDSVYVMGWSMGGNTALLLGADRPDKVRKVISGASNSKSTGLTQEGHDLLKEYTVEAVKEDKDWLANYQKLSPQPDKWVKFWEDNQKMWAREIKVPDEKVSSIAVPVMVIRGDRDMIRLEHSIEMYRLLKNGQLCVYPHIGHDMPELKSDMLCRIAIDFLKEKTGGETGN